MQRFDIPRPAPQAKIHYLRGQPLPLMIFLFSLTTVVPNHCLAADQPGVNQDTLWNLDLTNANPSPQTAAPTASSNAAPTRGFFTRLGHAYLDDWTVDSNGSPPAPEPPRRGTPRPLNSPPFRSADWPIGGTVVIGAPDCNSYMLMQAINQNKSRIKMYGWSDIGGNASTSK